MAGRTAQGEAATQVILSTFRLNGLLLAAGDRLSGEDGLTAARWQVLGAVAMSERPVTVPQIARRMGLARQSVHATVARLVTDGVLERLPNVDHVRSPRIALTAVGEERWRAVRSRQATWVNALADGLAAEDLATAERVLHELGRRLEAGRQGGTHRMAEKEES